MALEYSGISSLRLLIKSLFHAVSIANHQFQPPEQIINNGRNMQRLRVSFSTQEKCGCLLPQIDNPDLNATFQSERVRRNNFIEEVDFKCK